MARLYPSASLDDAVVNKQYRDLVHSDLENHKRATARTALASLGEGGWHGPVDEEQQQAWLVVLADLRLVLGVRLGVTEETMGLEPDPADPEQRPLALIHYLGWLQQSLIDATDPPTI